MERSKLAKYNLPDVPGVYLFKQGRKVLYVGKATSLRDRVRSYFDDDLIATRGPRVVDMVTNATGMIYHTTPTVLEALVREAALIRKYHPRANVEGKDDKSFLYAAITQEAIPRVLVLRGKDIDFKNRKPRLNLWDNALRFNLGLRAIYGPFPSGAQLREGLRLIRRIFPFFDTAKPVGAQGPGEIKIRSHGVKKHHDARIEFNQQIGIYPRVFDARDYRRTIRNVMLFLAGRAKTLRKVLATDMKRAAKDERFEDAAEARRQLYALDHIQDVSLVKDENRYQRDVPIGTSLGYRIEAYDTAHLGGTNAVGVMVVVEDGRPVKREYRTFNLRGKDFVSPSGASGLTKSKHGRRINDDIASLKELLSRRLRHPEWPFPHAIVIDGGTTHKKAAETAIALAGFHIPVAAVVKDERHRPREVIGALRAGISEVDTVLANAEAHRFSLARHRKARSRGLH